MNDQRFQRIRESLASLARNDARFRVFGAERHRYVSTPVSEPEISAFEDELRIALPGDFRSFLREVGAGAGPSYGIFSLDRMREEARLGLAPADFDEVDEGPSEEGDPARPFSVPWKVLAADSDPDSPGVEVPGGANGLLAICDHGCAIYTVLVTTGELQGVVLDWHQGPRPDKPGHWPLVSFPEIRRGVQNERIRCSSFLEWYEDWLRSAAALAAELRSPG